VRWPIGLFFHGDTRVPDRQRDAVRFQVRPERGSSLWILETKEPRSGFDHDHLRTEACECLPQLYANSAPAEDCERCRQLPRNRRLAIGPEINGVQAGNRRDRRGAAGGDHDGPTRVELLASNDDRAQTVEFPFTSKEPGSGCFERGSRPAVIEVACHPQHACRDLGEVDRPFDA